jgi:hypothetical protein
MGSLIAWMVLAWQGAQPAGSGFGTLFWVWIAVMVVLIALFVWRSVRPRRTRPPMGPR